MAEERKIYVPEGKELHDSKGLYRYIGPRVVLPSKGRVFTVYTDGSPLQYVEDKKAPKKQEFKQVEKQVFQPKVETKKIVEPFINDSDSKQS